MYIRNESGRQVYVPHNMEEYVYRKPNITILSISRELALAPVVDGLGRKTTAGDMKEYIFARFPNVIIDPEEVTEEEKERMGKVDLNKPAGKVKANPRPGLASQAIAGPNMAMGMNTPPAIQKFLTENQQQQTQSMPAPKFDPIPGVDIPKEYLKGKGEPVSEVQQPPQEPKQTPEIVIEPDMGWQKDEIISWLMENKISTNEAVLKKTKKDDLIKLYKLWKEEKSE